MQDFNLIEYCLLQKWVLGKTKKGRAARAVLPYGFRSGVCG